MSERFDPYVQWLGIRDPQRPPNHYCLLGITTFEDDPGVIANAADRQMAHVRTFQAGNYAAISQRVLNELAKAKVCLLNAARKREYDAQLRRQIERPQSATDTVPLESGAPVKAAPPRTTTTESVVVAPVVGGGTKSSSARRRGGGKKSGAGKTVAVAVGSVAALVLILGGVVVALMMSGSDESPPTRVANASQGEKMEQTDAPNQVKSTAPVELEKTNKSATPPAKKTDLAAATANEPPMDPGDSVNPPPDLPQVDASRPAPWEQPPPARGQLSLPKAQVQVTASVAAALTSARAAMAQRNLPKAETAVELAKSKSKTPDDSGESSRLRDILDSLTRFWEAVADADEHLSPGDKLTYRNQPVTVVRNDQGSIRLRAAGNQEKDFSTDPAGMDPALAIGLAMASGKLSKAGPAAHVAVGSFLAMDRAGDRAAAKTMWEEAGRQGMASDLLLAEVQFDYTNLPTAAVAVDPMPANDGRRRNPVPNRRELTAAMTKVSEVYGNDLRTAVTVQQKSALAQKLLNAVEETRDPTLRFALFEWARTAAVDAGNIDQVFGLLNLLAEDYEVDAAAERKKSLAATLKKAPNGQALDVLLYSLSIQLEKLSAAGDFDTALDLISTTNRYRNYFSNERRAQYDAIRQWLTNAQKYAALAAKASETLAQSPDDPVANLTVGRYLCFYRNDWENGLPHLAKSDHADLRELAIGDLTGAADAEAQYDRGEDWFNRAKQPKNGKFADELLLRARHWFEAALPKLTGFKKQSAEQRLGEISHLVQHGPAPKYLSPQEVAVLKKRAGFYPNGVGESFNICGRNEKWLRGSNKSLNGYPREDDPYYVIVPDGTLLEMKPPYVFTDKKAIVFVPTRIQLDPAYYQNLKLLYR